MRFIRLNDENIVIAIRFGTEIVNGEIQSEVGELGQRMLSNGTFEDVPVEPIEPMPTIEEKLDSLEEQILNGNLTTYDVLATIYEENANNTITQFDVLATMFDEILSLREEIEQLKGATN